MSMADHHAGWIKTSYLTNHKASSHKRSVYEDQKDKRKVYNWLDALINMFFAINMSFASTLLKLAV